MIFWTSAARYEKGFSLSSLKVEISEISGVRWVLVANMATYAKAVSKVRPQQRSLSPPWDLLLVLGVLGQPLFAPLESVPAELVL